MPRGGKREGAGRRAKSSAGPAVTVSIKVAPDVVERLRALDKTQAEVLEMGVDAAEAIAHRAARKRKVRS